MSKTRHHPRKKSLDPVDPGTLDEEGFTERLNRAIREGAAARGGGSGEVQAEWLRVSKKTLNRWLLPRTSGGFRPNLAQLYTIAERTGYSVDWLLGFPVPPLRSEVEAGQDTGLTLLLEIARAYERRQPVARRRDGLAATLNGEITYQPLPEQDEVPSIGELLNGQPVLNVGMSFGVQVLAADPATVLARICDLVGERADEWERQHASEEEAEVRARVAELAKHVRRIAQIEEVTEAQVMRTLTKAALDPLDRVNQHFVAKWDRMLMKPEHQEVVDDPEVLSESEDLEAAVRAIVRAQGVKEAGPAVQGMLTDRREHHRDESVSGRMGIAHPDGEHKTAHRVGKLLLDEKPKAANRRTQSGSKKASKPLRTRKRRSLGKRG